MSFYFIEIDQKLNWSLNSNLGGLRFGIDADGNYGYKKAGADTVIPFSKSIDTLNEPFYSDSQYLSLFNSAANSHISGSKTITYTATKNGTVICHYDNDGEAVNRTGHTVDVIYEVRVGNRILATKAHGIYIFPIKTEDVVSYTVRVDGNSTGGAAAYFYGTIYMDVY